MITETFFTNKIHKIKMELIDEMIDFLGKSITKYHFASYARNLLKKRKLMEVETIQLETNDIPKKGFLFINRTTLIAYELGTSDKSLIFSSSINGKMLNINDLNNLNENGMIQCSINNNESNLNDDSELWSSFDYQFAGELFIKENSRLRSYLFKSDQPIGIIENNKAFLSLPDQSINSYLENNLSITIQDSNLVEKNLFLIPDTQSLNNYDNIFVGSCRSLMNIPNMSTFGASYLILKAFLSSLGKGSFNKFIIISPNDSNAPSSSLSSYINLILSSKSASLSPESLNFNIGGIESTWSSHFPSPTTSKFLSKGIVIQNFQKNDIILDRLAKFGIPVHFDQSQEIDYSLDQDQLIINNGNLPIKLSLPMFNYRQVTETISISDIYNFYNSLYEICMI